MTSLANKIVRHLRTAVLRPEGEGLTDGQLLEHYLGQREERAFAALVRRHGPMVWGVCRRMLTNHHDAEDAFQATFLVLVRKGESVRPREMVANWLYGVACHTARKARALAAKRAGRERQVPLMPEPETVALDLHHDLQPLLDRELGRLPDKYRTPVVLCDLEGKSYKEAARQLGCPEGTLAARLSRARAMLAQRLSRHGLAISAGTLATVLAASRAEACVPSALMSATIHAGTLYAAGPAAAGGVISGNVAALTEGVLHTMLLSKLKLATAVVVIVGVLGMGNGLVPSSTAGAAPMAAHVGVVPGQDRNDGSKNRADDRFKLLFKEYDLLLNVQTRQDKEAQDKKQRGDFQRKVWDDALKQRTIHDVWWGDAFKRRTTHEVWWDDALKQSTQHDVKEWSEAVWKKKVQDDYRKQFEEAYRLSIRARVLQELDDKIRKQDLQRQIDKDVEELRKKIEALQKIEEQQRVDRLMKELAEAVDRQKQATDRMEQLLKELKQAVEKQKKSKP